MELWAWAKDIPSLHKTLQSFPNSVMELHFKHDKTFKIEVETFCKHFSQKEKVAKIEVPIAKKQDPDQMWVNER